MGLPKMDIAIVEAKSPEEHVFSRFKLPRIGTPLLATILEKQEHNVVALCEDIEEFDWLELVDKDLVGISTITATAERAYKMADWLRSVGSKAVTVLGGVHVTFLPDEGLDHADYVVRGEGEESLLELLEVIHGVRDPSTVLGLSYWEDGVKVHNRDRPLIEDLDALPFPNLELIRGHEKISLYPIVTSRGCPYGCNFCSVTPMFGRGYRFRSPENVLKELEEKKPKLVFFYDDMFNAMRDRMMAISQGIIDRGLKLRWTAQVRTNIVMDKGKYDKKGLRRLKKSGAICFYIGFESIEPETLRAFNKGQGLEDILFCIRMLRKWKHRIRIHGMFVLGSEFDTVKTVRATVKFAMKHRLNSVQFMVLTPLPGCQQYYQLDEEGRIFNKTWRYYNAQHVVYWPVKVLPSVLHREVMSAYLRFYSWTQAIKTLCYFDITGVFYRVIGRGLVITAVAQSEPDLPVLESMERDNPQRVGSLDSRALSAGNGELEASLTKETVK